MVDVGDVSIALSTAGEGPPLLLLHGYPQTRSCWHRVAPVLARRFTVVAADLRGYGQSSKPPGGPDHAAYAKRAMAADMVAAMEALGHARFAVAGHDRGGRVAHRMALDHPDAGHARGRPGHRADADPVRRHRPGLRDGLLPLVLPDPARRPAGDDDRSRPRVVPARDRPPVERAGGARRRGGAARVRAVVRRPGGHPRLVRGLPRGRRHRPGARRARRRRPDRLPAAGPVGRARGDAPPLRRPRHLAPDGARRARPCAPVGHFLPEECPAATRRPWRSSSPPEAVLQAGRPSADTPGMRETPTRGPEPALADLHCIATRATLCFADDALDPDEVTRRLGVEPTSAFRRGRHRSRVRRGPPRRHRRLAAGDGRGRDRAGPRRPPARPARRDRAGGRGGARGSPPRWSAPRSSASG